MRGQGEPEAARTTNCGRVPGQGRVTGELHTKTGEWDIGIADQQDQGHSDMHSI